MCWVDWTGKRCARLTLSRPSINMRASIVESALIVVRTLDISRPISACEGVHRMESARFYCRCRPSDAIAANPQIADFFRYNMLNWNYARADIRSCFILWSALYHRESLARLVPPRQPVHVRPDGTHLSQRRSASSLSPSPSVSLALRRSSMRTRRLLGH